jgi:hypothetical protein
MAKITDYNFELPNIFAQLHNGDLPNSANKPIIITGKNQINGEDGSYVVKFKRAERMSNEASMRELLASFIAMQLDVNIVSPAIIEVTPEFVETLKGHDCWKVANMSLGYNYGSLYKGDYSTLILNQPLNQSQLSYAQDVFCFDLFIQNSDRTFIKPNMLTNGIDIYALDHEIAFGFIFTPFITPLVWEMQENNKVWIRNHCLLSLIKGERYDFEGFTDRFENLTNQFWEKAWASIPNELRTDQFNEIREKLTMIASQKELFTLELKKLLS